MIAVYSWKTSTSTRLYMLALAIADLVVCIIGVVWTIVEFNSTNQAITKWCLHMSLAFSAVVLSFVSIERLMANIYKDYELLTPIFTASVTISRVVIMIGCYKSVSLLFIITAVFSACWMSQWLSDVGFQIPSTAKHLMMFIIYYITLLTPFICYFTNTIQDCSNVFSSYIYCRLANYVYYLLQYNTIQYNTIQYNTIQYNTIQYNTIQYNTIQYNTIQYNTIQYNTIQYNTIQ